MNNKAIINGQEYTLLEILPLLDGGQQLILCEDGSGKRAVCSELLWYSCVLKDAHTALVHAHSSAQEKIELFLSVFKGRDDVYARRYHSTKTGKSGYTPVCKNEWAHGLCDKRRHKCPECPNREFKPLTAEAVKAHLIGRDPLCRDVAAIYPMLEDNTTWLLVADFDEEKWQLDVTAFCKCCKDMDGACPGGRALPLRKRCPCMVFLLGVCFCCRCPSLGHQFADLDDGAQTRTILFLL